jgi:hypothetical protein
MSLKKEKFFKRLAEVLGVTQRNMDAALDFIEKEESEKVAPTEVKLSEEALKEVDEEFNKTPLTDNESDDQRHDAEEADGHNEELHSHGNEVE